MTPGLEDRTVDRAWTVVLPLKGGPGAKSRLGGPPGIATAIALDSLSAVLGARGVVRVLVVTGDPVLAADCTAMRAEVIAQSSIGQTSPGGGLAAAIADGVAAASGPCAVLLGDVPALLPGDLDQALAACQVSLIAGPHSSVFVPDAEGVGTVLLAALRPVDLRPRFGPGSATAHAQTGAHALDLALPRLRRDVDTPADLAAVLALGAGPRTREAVICGTSPNLGVCRPPCSATTTQPGPAR